MAELDSYTVLADKHGWGFSEKYRKILQFLMTPRQADMVARLPLETEELAREFAMSEEDVKSELDVLFRRGVVYPRDYKSRLGYRFARTVNQLHDGTQSLLGIQDIYSEAELRELFVVWEDFMDNEIYPYRAKVIQQLERPVNRIVPAYRSIKDDPNMQPWENFMEALKEKGRAVIMSCSCRARKINLGDGCAHTDDATCFNFGRSVDYSLERGNGREITYDEAVELWLRIEDSGCVLIAPGFRSLTAGSTTCVCCPDCCIYIEPVHLLGHENYPHLRHWDKSRWDPIFNLDACTGCQDCVERCPWSAITIEQVAGYKRLKPVVNLDYCAGCGQCVLACETQAKAVKMECVRPIDYVPEAPPQRGSWEMNIPRNWGLDPTVVQK